MRRTFAFATAELERAFQSSLVSEKVRLVRVTAVLAIVLIVSFAILDLWALPAAVAEAWLLRAAMLAAVVPVLAISGRALLIRHYVLVMTLLFASLAVGVIAMTTLAAPTDMANGSYPVGLVLIIIGLFTLTYVPLWCSALLAGAIILAYGVIAVAAGRAQAGQGSLLAAHLFFMVAAGVMGGVAQAVRDRYSRESFLLRLKLQHDVRLRGEAARLADQLARRDPLTALANRRHLLEVLDRLLDQAGQGGYVFVFYIDLDAFKPINDVHGHAAGDRALAALGERLRAVDNEMIDLVARWGGDEFVAVAGMVAGQESLIDAVAAGLLARIREPVAVRGHSVALSASIGVAVGPEDGSSAETLIEAADRQMYRAKRSAARERIAFSAAARRALDGGAL